MRKNAQDGLALLRPGAPRCQCRSKPPLVAGEHALGMPALMIQVGGERAPHLAPIGCLRPATAHVAPVERDHRVWDTQLLAAEPVVVLRVIAGIGERRVELQDGSGLAHRRCEVGRVLSRPGAGDRAKDEVRVRMDNSGQLRPGAPPMVRPLRLTPTHPVVEAHVPGFEAGRIDSGYWS